MGNRSLGRYFAAMRCERCKRRAHDGPCHDYPKGIEAPVCKECGHPIDFHSVRCRHSQNSGEVKP
jgi:NAD-dependent SIR2 family protein deacetylase